MSKLIAYATLVPLLFLISCRGGEEQSLSGQTQNTPPSEVEESQPLESLSGDPLKEAVPSSFATLLSLASATMLYCLNL